MGNRPDMKSYRQSYRPDIDGLRAVAVVAVILFHAFPEYVPSGFVGVDIFFVISGFLISGLTFDEVERGTFAISDFYVRRIRRIFPALIAVLFAVLGTAWFILLPDDFSRLGKQVAASAVFLANFYFWFQSGYFSPDAQSFPLLHLWSLGVEEQFYIVWPLLVLALGNRHRWIVAIGLLGPISFVLSVTLSEHREFDFFSPFTRTWELMVGAVLAWFARGASAGVGWRPLAVESATFLGFGLVVASCFLFDQQVPYPGWRAALPVAGSALLIGAGNRSRIAALVLGSRAFVFTGLISYPLYLWHWPILVLAVGVKFSSLTLLERGLAVMAAYALAWLTFKWVETPIRSGALRWRSTGILVSTMATVAVAGLVLISAGGFENRFPKELNVGIGPDAPRAWRLHECLLDLSTGEKQFAESCIETKRPVMLVWGDSTAASLMPGLREAQSRTAFGLSQLTASNCPPISNSSVPRPCRENNNRVLGLIERIRPNVVVLHASAQLNQDTIEGWIDTVARLREYVPRVVVLGPVPAWKRGLPGQALNYYITHRSFLPLRSDRFVYDLWDEASARTLFVGLGAEYISAWEVFCTLEGCLTRVNENGALTTRDRIHLTEEGSAMLIGAVKDKLLQDQDSH